MARSGGFSAGLNPFGGGSLGSLSQYDIGADLADLEVYKVETAWGNGLATDDEYLAALRKALNATDPNTQRRESAQNKLDDAVYRIGRSKADAKGLDALIAFDQAAIAKMKPENVRYRDVSDSLDNELAQRRSRDYGKLVVDYNAGKASTESLLSWVKNTLTTINKDDPDFDNWKGTQADLQDRLNSERDAKAYQDFQQGRMKGDAFLAYLTKRRDSYGQLSPQYADWDRKLEDAKKQVKDQKQSEADQAFFNSYEEGHKSDAQYLSYLRTRLNGMAADDPDRGTWQHRLNQAAFSLAEDKLRFDVQKGKAPVSRLVHFYKDYRATLNPGSAEWRTITRALDSLAGYSRSGGGGGGGRSGGGRSGGGKSSGVGSALPTGKSISASSVDGAMALMNINPYSDAKSQKNAKAFFDLNYTSLENARQRGDHVFLFYDPRKPGQVVQARNPDGSPAVDAKGKPVYVRGSAYLPVSDDLFAQFDMLKANYQYGLAELALGKHDTKGYADHLRQGLNAQDHARLVDNQANQRSYDRFYDQAKDGIDAALRIGDYATALNLSNELAQRIAGELDSNPMLDDTRRGKLEDMGEKLANNPLIPTVDPGTGRQIGGAVDLAGSKKDRNGNFTDVSLRPGWHQVLDTTDEKGGPAWGLKYDNRQDGSWEANHVPVTTSYGNHIVKGEVTRSTAGTQPAVFVNTEDGMIRAPGSADYMTFTDEHGNVVKAYSIDGGKTWVRSLSGTAPALEVNKPLKKSPDGKSYVDAATGNKVFEAGPDGWQFVGQPGDVGWYGSGAKATHDELGHELYGVGRAIDNVLGGMFGAKKKGGGWAGTFSDLTGPGGDFGAPGQHMQLVTSASDGSVSLLTDRQASDWERALLGDRGGPGARRTGPGKFGPGNSGVNVDKLLGDAKGIAGPAGDLLGSLGSALSGILRPGLGLGSFGGNGAPGAFRPKTPPAPPIMNRGGAPGAFRPPPKATYAPPPALRDNPRETLPPPVKPKAVPPPVRGGAPGAFRPPPTPTPKPSTRRSTSRRPPPRPAPKPPARSAIGGSQTRKQF